MNELDATLTTTGRRTGQPRSVRLYAFPDGQTGRSVLVGSGWAGGSSEPDWVLNLRAEPRCTLRLGTGAGGMARPGRATEIAPGVERDRLWRVATASFPYYGGYQAKTARLIPVFVFEPDAQPDDRAMRR